jgi:hypothetical protein
MLTWVDESARDTGCSRSEIVNASVAMYRCVHDPENMDGDVAMVTSLIREITPEVPVVVQRGKCLRGYGVQGVRCAQWLHDGGQCPASTGPGGYCPYEAMRDDVLAAVGGGPVMVDAPAVVDIVAFGGERDRPTCGLGFPARVAACDKRDGGGRRACPQAGRVMVDHQRVEGPCPWVPVGSLPKELQVIAYLRDGVEPPAGLDDDDDDVFDAAAFDAGLDAEDRGGDE